jgi:hypothetical protein
MQELEHWNFAEDFSAEEAASLILGYPPGSIELNQLEPVMRRIRSSYRLARFWHMSKFDGGEEMYPIDPLEMLGSVALLFSASNLFQPGLDDVFYEWMRDDKVSGLETQQFGRQVLADWLLTIGMQSKYSFMPIKKTLHASAPNDLQLVSGPSVGEIDPCDLPAELDAANMAFRAVTTGYGESPSMRNRLIEYLKVHYPHFNPEQVKRIATVANSDKTTGRKKRDRE